MQAPFFLLVYGFWGVPIAAHHEFLFFALFSFLWRFRNLRTLSSPKALWARWCTFKKSRFCSAKPDNSSGELEMFTCMFWKILIVTKWSSSREIAGKTHTFWFDWGPAGERPEVGIQSSSTKLSHIHRKWRASSLPLYVREIDTSGGGRIFGSTDFV